MCVISSQLLCMDMAKLNDLSGKLRQVEDRIGFRVKL